MTLQKRINKKSGINLSPLVPAAIIIIICLCSSSELKEGILSGIKLSVASIVPSLFPFFVISDYIYSSFIFEEKEGLSRILKNFFGIPPVGACAFILGNVCGFPLGAKCASDLYSEGQISKKECERLVMISNNPSLAFTVTAVGTCMLGDTFKGIILYVSVLISTLIIAFFSKEKYKVSKYSGVNQRQKFDLSASIKNAGQNSVTVSSFVIFFSGILGILNKLFENELVTAIFSIALEVGNASSKIAVLPLNAAAKISLLGFALGFSGFSVFCQALTFLPKDVKKAKILLLKFLEGSLSSFFAFIIYSMAY